MIKLSERPPIPNILAQKGQELRDELCAQVDAHSTTKLKFESKVYGQESVKESLKKWQHHKCCFCESKVSHVAHGDVEHFRPKGGWKQTEEDKLSARGYYWLAYDWENLFFSCGICNQTYKKNFFPLTDQKQRVTHHTGNIDQETPLLIHPADDSPDQHLGYRRHVVVGIDEKGQTSIKCYGLNRTPLKQQREEHYARLKFMSQLKEKVPADLASKIQESLENASHSSAEYAAMARSLLKEEAFT